MKIQLLDEKLKALVKTERKITHEILLLIQTLDLTKSYRELGYASLFEYLTKEVGYSEGSAQRRISSARLLKEIPQIEEDLKTGELNLTQVCLAQMAFRQEEKKTTQKLNSKAKELVLSKLRNKSSYETKKILKEECPSFEIPQSKPIPGSQQKVHITLELSEKEYEEIKFLLAKLSHKVPDQKIESALLYWARQLKKKEQNKENTQIKKDAEIKESTPRSSVTADPTELRASQASANQKSLPLRRWKQKRKAISVSVRKGLFQKAQNQCEFTSAEGKRCQSRHFLEIDHQLPIALGGGNEAENLRVLCRSHNQLSAKKWGVTGKSRQ